MLASSLYGLDYTFYFFLFGSLDMTVAGVDFIGWSLGHFVLIKINANIKVRPLGQFEIDIEIDISIII